MKHEKILKAIIIMFIISMNLINTNCRKSKYLSTKIQKSETKTSNEALDKLWNYLNNQLTGEENILYFLLGILSEFSPAFDAFYKSIKGYIGEIKQCYSAISKAFDEISSKIKEKAEAPEKIKNNKNIAAFYAKTEDPEKIKSYCESVKKETEEVLDLSQLTQQNRQYDIFSEIVAIIKKAKFKLFASNIEYCTQVYYLKTTPTEDIIKKFGSVKFFVKQCIFFKNLSCDKMNLEIGLVEFVTKALKYYDMSNNLLTCIVSIYDEINGNDKDKKKKDEKKDGKKGEKKDEKKDPVILGSTLLTDALANGLGLVANIFTLGTWGGVKGGYYLIKIAIDLKEIWDDVNKNFPYKVGKLIGKGILVAKSVILGKRRRNKKLKKMF